AGRDMGDDGVERGVGKARLQKLIEWLGRPQRKLGALVGMAHHLVLTGRGLGEEAVNAGVESPRDRIKRDERRARNVPLDLRNEADGEFAGLGHLIDRQAKFLAPGPDATA